MISSIPFKPNHVAQLELNEGYDGYQEVIQQWAENPKYYAETFVTDNGEVLACFSFCRISHASGEISALIGIKARKYPIGFIKHSRERLENLERIMNLSRVQAAVRKGYDFLLKYIELFGFEVEGLMRSFGGPGDDYFLYARVKK